MARDVGNDVLMSHTSNNLMDEVDDELEEDIDDVCIFSLVHCFGFSVLLL